MIKVLCRTNLDLLNEQWPHALPEVPRVGDLIQSATKHGVFQLTLQVCRVTWVPYGEEWIPEIEMHMTDFQKQFPSSRGSSGSIIAFYEWYGIWAGKRVNYFI